MTLVLLACAAVLAAAVPAGAEIVDPQETSQTQTRLRVFLDCSTCFADFLREEIKWVDYVRQPQDADVHLLATDSDTGGGGREVTLRFVGQGRFDGVNLDLKAVSTTGDPEDLRRRNVLRAVTVGFLSYLAREGRAGDVDLNVEAPDRPAPTGAARDPWNAWVYSVRGSASIDAEASNRQWNWSVDTSADRVTEAWKISIGARVDEETERFNLDEEDEDPLEVTRRERELEWFIARGAGPRWSFGLNGRLASSTFGNTRFTGRAAPAVEFSVFPYSEYATRQLLLQYSVGFEHAKYNEVTLFDRLDDTLGRHEFVVRLDQRQPWGSLEIRSELSQYLHDLGKHRFEVNGDLSWRLVRGLSLNVEGSASRIHDQLSLPRRGATPEEVLLRLRELRSDFEVSFEIGMTYSFGSLFNNVVNPRFGR